MKLLNYLFRNSPYIVVLAMATAFVSGLGNASLITLIHTALNSQDRLTQIGWQFVGLAVFSLVTAVISQLLLSYLYRKAVFDWQIHLSREILRAPLRQLEEVGNGELLTILNRDVPTIGGSLLPMLPLCTNIVVVFVCMGYLAWLSWKMFLGTLLVMLIGGFTYKVVLKRGRVTLKLAREESGELQGHFNLMTNGMKELKLHSLRRRAFFEKNLKPTAASIQHRFFLWSLFHFLTQTWARFLLLFVMGMILFVFPSLINFDTRILTGYILTLLYIRAMLLSIMGAFPALAQANVAFQKVEELGLRLTAGDSDDGLSVPDNPKHDWRGLEFSDVCHTYYREREDGNFTLGPINLTFKPGELVFLVGGNGSGKTTLAKLITGLYTPEAGKVYLNGDLVTDKNREQYRQLFSVVFADFQLFNDLLGFDTLHLDAQAQEYLVKLQLDHKVKVKDGRLSTTALSGGQRQRLALLTAYLEDRPFYIFDEWASNQDPVFKDVFYTQILPELKERGKTVPAITHDDKYFGLCDRIIKMDYGKLTEQNIASDGYTPITPTSLKLGH